MKYLQVMGLEPMTSRYHEWLRKVREAGKGRFDCVGHHVMSPTQ